MYRKLFSTLLLISAITFVVGCGRGKKLSEADFTANKITVETLSPGETTTILGSGFGDQQGQVLIGEKEATIVFWKDKAVRIRIPSIDPGTHEVSVQPFETKKDYAGKIGIRSEIDEKVNDWVDGGIASVDSAGMEPLIMVFDPVGPPVSGLFDYDSQISKNRDELISEIEWAYMMGVQAVQLYYPAELTTGKDRYADPSMDNLRFIISQVKSKCPGMLVQLQYAYMPEGNQAVARKMPSLDFETYYNLGSFEERDPATGMGIPSIPDISDVNLILADSRGHYKKPVPYVMTTWQAYEFQNFKLQGVSFGDEPTFILRMSLDRRAADNKKTYNDIKKLLPENSRVIATTTRQNVGQIIGYALSQGDHIAFGLHYSLYWPGDSSNYIRSNEFLIEKILQTAEKMNRPVATIEQARAMMNIPLRPVLQSAEIKVFNKLSEKPRKKYIGSGRDRRAVLDGLPSNDIADLAISWDQQEIWMITGAGIYYTDDNADTFSPVTLGRKNAAPTDITTTANGGVWIATDGTGILKTADYGKNFNRYNVESKSMNGDMIACMFAYGNEMYACTYSTEEGNPGTGIAYTTDAGANWFVWQAGFGLPFNDVRSIYVEDEWVYAGFGPYKTPSDARGAAVSGDFGKSWKMIGGVEAPVLDILVWHDGTLLLATKGAGIYAAGYNGSAARQLDGIPATATITDLMIDPRGWLWVVSDSGVFASADLGSFRSFTAADGLGSEFLTEIVSAPPSSILVGTRSTGDEEVEDGGLSRLVIPE